MLVFTGKEDEERSYLLSASDILATFKEIPAKEGAVLSLKGAHLLQASNYQILQKKLALEKIDHALKTADFRRNRRFVLGNFGSSVSLTPDQIDPDFILPLENDYGNIQEQFFEEKRKLQSIISEMNWALESMHEILKMTDPQAAYEKWNDDILSEYEGSLGRQTAIAFKATCFDDEDFLTAVKWHKERLGRLRDLGIETAYFKLINLFEQKLVSWLHKKRPAASKILKISVNYDKKSLLDPEILISQVNTEGAEISRKGMQKMYCKARDVVPGGDIGMLDSASYREELQKSLWRYVQKFTDSFDRAYFQT
ncbi:hypothetical protein L537_4424 [Bordetella hinzii 1277]|nr:hypothetical protein L537_4424 [Bordetella hinzii 1277]